MSERRGSFRPQPKDTVAYKVEQSDTLEGIAARYNITPSELARLNKLSSRIVFPGQIIYIPEKNSLQILEQIVKQSAAAVQLSASEESPKPGHAERIPKGSFSADDISTSQLKNEFTGTAANDENVEFKGKESLRINSKYVTDGEGVVSGVLIVTTNHIIFDPNVSDPLVIEYGMDKYGVEAPMGWIVKAALYSDIFHIKKDSKSCDDKSIHIYHSKNSCLIKSKSHEDRLVSPSKSQVHQLSTNVIEKETLDSVGATLTSALSDELSKINEQVDETDSHSPIPETYNSTVQDSIDISHDENKNRTGKPILSSVSSIDSDDAPESRKASVSSDDGGIVTIEFGSPKKKSQFEKTKNKIHKGLKRLSITDSLFSNSNNSRRMSLPVFSSLPDFKSKNLNVKSPTSTVCDKLESENKTVTVGPTYVNMVEYKPELFTPIDKLIPRPATSFCDTPLYLCLRMGHPLDKDIPRPNPVVHFGQKMKPEYWFSIPKDNVDTLYNFFLRWFPEKYGEIDNINYEELGFTPIEFEISESCDETVSSEQRRSSWNFPWRRKSKEAEISDHSTLADWELLDFLSTSSNTVQAPELLTPSNILNDEQILEIAKHLPARAMNSWNLIYGTTAHGFSLKTMYRKMLKYDCPVLIVIANQKNEIFGALLSNPLKISDHFYGTGESFLFTFCPEFKVYHWSGENNYFIKGNTDSFMVGSSEGHFGLWLDDDLFRGFTNSCQTFANEPLCPDQDFEIKSLEAWGFV